MANYRFQGTLCGYLCDECSEPLFNVKVRLYRVDRQAITETELVQRAVAQPKDTLVLLSQEAVDAKQSRLIAEVDTNERGGFSFQLGDRQKYAGEAFEIDVYCGTVPHRKPTPKAPVPRQFSITTLQPQWRNTEGGFLGGFDYCIPYRFWCNFRQLYGAWVICGDVDICKTDAPLGGVRVFAYDVQFIQDAPLGSAVTDGFGKFRIDYATADFEKSICPTLEYEWFGSGPDVYFRIETLSGTPILVEPRSRAHSSDRDAGPCLCVELCVDQVPDIPPVDLSAFTNLGVYRFASDIDSAPLGTGLTLGDGRAFYSDVRLNGVLAKHLNGQPLEYMFEVKNLSAGAYTQVPQAQIATTKIGVLEKYAPAFVGDPNPVKTFDYEVNGTASPTVFVTSFTADGWIRVPQENNVFGAAGNFVANGDMIRLITSSLAAFPPDDVTGLLAGQNATGLGPLVQNKHFAIRMWVREAGNVATQVVAGECQNVAINNTLYNNESHHPSWAGFVRNGELAVYLVDIAELIGAGCKELTNSLTVLFSAVHPTLGAVSIGMQGPGGPYTFTLPAAVAGQRFGTATNGFTFTDLTDCAYLVTLSVQVLLTTGDAVPDNQIDQIAFCKHSHLI